MSRSPERSELAPLDGQPPYLGERHAQQRAWRRVRRQLSSVSVSTAQPDFHCASPCPGTQRCHSWPSATALRIELLEVGAGDLGNRLAKPLEPLPQARLQDVQPGRVERGQRAVRQREADDLTLPSADVRDRERPMPAIALTGVSKRTSGGAGRTSSRRRSVRMRRPGRQTREMPRAWW